MVVAHRSPVEAKEIRSSGSSAVGDWRSDPKSRDMECSLKGLGFFDGICFYRIFFFNTGIFMGVV